MAFDILRFLGPEAANRLMQPQTMGPANMLTAPAMPPMDPPRNVAQMQVAPPQPAQQQMPTAPAMGQPVAPQPTPATGGFGSGIDKQYLNDFFLGMAMGKDPMQSLALGAAQANKGKSSRGDMNETVRWLTGKGMDEGQARMVASNPQTLQQYLTQIMQPQDPMKALQQQKMQLEIQGMQNPSQKMTDDQREYAAAKDQGFDGTFMDYMVKMKEAGRNQVNIDTGVKLPSGFRWVDPNDQNKGVVPIKGGPGEQIPGELAARIGMGDNFLNNDLPILKQQESLDSVTGPIDRLQAMAGYGKPAEVERKFQSGVEVLSRLLSGAGVTQIEVDEKKKRYMPTMFDTPESLKTKLTQLESEIKAAGDAAMRGRGGNISSSGEDPLGLR